MTSLGDQLYLLQTARSNYDAIYRSLQAPSAQEAFVIGSANDKKILFIQMNLFATSHRGRSLDGELTHYFSYTQRGLR